MGEKEESAGEFRVVDKRRFTSEGETRNPSEESSEHKNSEPEMSEKANKAVLRDEPGRSVYESGTESARGTPDSQQRVDFSSLVVSLGTQALVLLGEMPNADNGAVKINFEAAKQTIDIIGMLEEKTKGNLSVEESHLVSEILSSLRLAFVKKLEEKKGA